MLKAFTRNYEDNSTEAGFQFTFYCNICNDGFKSSFIPSESGKKGSFLRSVGEGAGLLGNLFGGAVQDLGWNMSRGADILSQKFTGMSAEWQKEHEAAFDAAQLEAQAHFHRCHGCHKWICSADFNEDEGLCTECAPREKTAVAKARAEALRNNLAEAAASATVWTGKLESQTITCPSCGKPAGNGKFCTECGADLSMKKCKKCGAMLAKGTKFCGECGAKLEG